MKLSQIINEIQRKEASTYLDRQNVSGVYGVNSLGDLFVWHNKAHKSKKNKPKRIRRKA